MNEGDVLFFRLSLSKKGIWITSGRFKYGLRGNKEHIVQVLRGEKDFAVLEIVKKTKQGS